MCHCQPLLLAIAIIAVVQDPCSQHRWSSSSCRDRRSCFSLGQRWWSLKCMLCLKFLQLPMRRLTFCSLTRRPLHGGQAIKCSVGFSKNMGHGTSSQLSFWITTWMQTCRSCWSQQQASAAQFPQKSRRRFPRAKTSHLVWKCPTGSVPQTKSGLTSPVGLQ